MCRHDKLSVLESTHILWADICEERMFEGFFHRNPASGVQSQHLHAEIQSAFLEVLEMGFGIDCLELGEGGLEVW